MYECRDTLEDAFLLSIRDLGILVTRSHHNSIKNSSSLDRVASID
jgi:hypothetical protein